MSIRLSNSLRSIAIVATLAFISSIVALTVVSSSAFAQKRKSKSKSKSKQIITFATPLKTQPGEATKTVIKLPVGTKIEVMGRKGRWVRVRARGKLGWVPRTTIGRPQTEGDGWGADQIQVDGDGKRTDIEVIEVFAVRRTPVRERASKRASKVFTVKRSDRLVVTDRKGSKWLQVRNRRGASGWIRTSAVETASGRRLSGTAMAALEKRAAEQEQPDASLSNDNDNDNDIVVDGALNDSDESMSGGLLSTGPDRTGKYLSYRGLQVAAQASVGLSSYSRSFSSNGESALGGYRINAGAMAAAATFAARKHLSKIFVGGRLGISTQIGAPGIRFQNEDGEVSDANGFQVHQFGVAGEVGAMVNKSHPVRVAATVGANLGYFMVSKIQNNPGLLAREKLVGMELGINASTAMSRQILVSTEFLWTPSASLSQTTNLEDGMDSTVWAIGGGARATYLVDDQYSIEVGYFGRRVRYKFTGQSTRQFDVTRASRKDLNHSFTLGAARVF